MSNTTAKKRCLRCERLLPLEAFSPSKKHRDGHNNVCRLCSNERSRQKYRAKVSGKAMPPLPKLKKELRKTGTKKVLLNGQAVRWGVTCAFHCANYPCFEGINNLSSNLALSCHNFKER